LWNARLFDPSICQNPITADARIAGNCVHWSVLGRGEITENGFVCKNSDPYFVYASYSELEQSWSQNSSDSYDPYDYDYHLCDDYEVRFCCPKGKLILLVCDDFILKQRYLMIVAIHLNYFLRYTEVKNMVEICLGSRPTRGT